MTDVGTTPRKPLSPTKRLAIFELRGGICCVCTKPIRAGERWIDEHVRALGLGGSNDDANRDIAHEKCAAIKTREEDMPRINKAKDQKKAALGIKAAPSRPLRSRGFPASGKTREPRIALPPRPLYRKASTP
ncbi:hypothetical protein SAMN05519103_00308 [Rhizobiales bacterium GAS113]|nr:hypothetical protein SAMN05519103_00308 [Rhizobiales bacterium GAS113]